MGAVELDVNYMLNIAFCRVELATTRGISNAALVSKRQSHQCQKHRQERCYNKYTSKVVPPESFYLVHNYSSVSNLQWSLKHYTKRQQQGWVTGKKPSGFDESEN